MTTKLLTLPSHNLPTPSSAAPTTLTHTPGTIYPTHAHLLCYALSLALCCPLKTIYSALQRGEPRISRKLPIVVF